MVWADSLSDSCWYRAKQEYALRSIAWDIDVMHRFSQPTQHELIQRTVWLRSRIQDQLPRAQAPVRYRRRHRTRAQAARVRQLSKPQPVEPDAEPEGLASTSSRSMEADMLQASTALPGKAHEDRVQVLLRPRTLGWIGLWRLPRHWFRRRAGLFRRMQVLLRTGQMGWPDMR